MERDNYSLSNKLTLEDIALLKEAGLELDERPFSRSSKTTSAVKYAADLTDETPTINSSGKWEKMDFKDPAALIEFFDDNIIDGLTTLHPWQVEISEALGGARPNQQHPYKLCLCACNGSGKDAFVIAPFVVWMALTKIRSLTIITSSSGVQLTAQTEGYIRSLAQKINEYFGELYFKINQRFIKCLKSGSEIRLFATDEEGKAEGYHPLEPGAEMAIIVNEAKSVKKEIFGALKRCTGFNYWLNVSTPGEPYGDFHYSFTKWPNSRHISTFDCPHLSSEERESDKQELGEHSALYRSKHLALFTSLGGQVIIPLELLNSIIERTASDLIPKLHQDWPLRIGIDLAAGGDETVITVVKGNCITNRIAFIQKDTMLAADIIEHHLKETIGVSLDYGQIYADDGGVGRGIIDNLIRKGWGNIHRIHNQSPATNKKEFGNAGAERWFRTKRILEEFLFRLDNTDEKFNKQISNRYYKQQGNQGRILLESKKEAKAEGRPSPDRADSFLLALTGLTIDDYLKTSKTKDESVTNKPKEGKRLYNPAREYDEITFSNYDHLKQKPKNGSKLIYGSMSKLLARN